MAEGRKITLGEARISSAVGDHDLLRSGAGRCGRLSSCRCNGHRRAIERWGDERRLDELALVCPHCAGRSVDVRPLFENAPDATGHTRASGLN